MDPFDPSFWTWLAVMLSTRAWFAFRVWRSGERISADRAARRREGLWPHVVAYPANWVPLVFAALIALNFNLRIRGEERMMLEEFGDEYRAYMKRSGRLFPA